MIKKIFLFLGVLALFLSVIFMNRQIEDKKFEENTTQIKEENLTADINTTEENLTHTLTKTYVLESNESDAFVDKVLDHSLGDLDEIIKRRMVRVLIVPNEMMYHLKEGKPSGIVYEVMHEFEKIINRHFPHDKKHLKIRVVFVPVGRDQLINALLSGKGDIAFADLAVTQNRKKIVDFSHPMFKDIHTIVVTGPASPEVNSTNELSGKDVYTRRSSHHFEYINELNEDLTEHGLEPVHVRPVPDQIEDEDLMELVNAGLIDTILVEDYKVKLWSKAFENLVAHNEFTVKNDINIAWMIRKNSPKLLKEINAFIKTHKKGTLHGNIMINRYFKNYKFIRPDIIKSELKKFEKVVDIFKKYAEQYDLNYKLMIAQAYQESKLNQNAKSHVGAIGVMQLMPATGKDMNCGDIRKLEPNIHAGIKYHKWLIKHYFNDENMDALNKTLFTFAAYNAGPGRVRKLRKTAKERGLNPNIWFDNVEVIAAEKIGRETVTYVSNIFKYYVAYALYEIKKSERVRAKEALIKKVQEEKVESNTTK